MKTAVYGASGMIRSRVAEEAVQRGCEVIGLTRSGGDVPDGVSSRRGECEQLVVREGGGADRRRRDFADRSQSYGLQAPGLPRRDEEPGSRPSAVGGFWSPAARTAWRSTAKGSSTHRTSLRSTSRRR